VLKIETEILKSDFDFPLREFHLCAREISSIVLQSRGIIVGQETPSSVLAAKISRDLAKFED
jgi:hypothetical protein